MLYQGLSLQANPMITARALLFTPRMSPAFTSGMETLPLTASWRQTAKRCGQGSRRG